MKYVSLFKLRALCKRQDRMLFFNSVLYFFLFCYNHLDVILDLFLIISFTKIVQLLESGSRSSSLKLNRYQKCDFLR